MKKLLLLLLFVISSTTYAQFWQKVSTGFTAVSSGLSEITYADANTVWATAYDGVTATNNVQKWAKSSDGGNTWTNGNINVGNANLGIANLSAISSTTCFALVNTTTTSGTALGGVWKTVDSGVTWTRQTTAVYNSSTSFPNIVHFFNANDGVTMGDPAGGYFEIYTTSNGGTNWTRVPSANIPVPLNGAEYGYTGLFYTVGDIIWFGTDQGRIYRSTNKGLTWTVGPVTPVVDFGGVTTSGTTGRFIFKDINNGILKDNNFQLWNTSDGGTIWNVVNYNGDFRDGQIDYVPGTPNTYVMTGNDVTASVRGTSFSEDGGLNWIDINTLEPTPANTGGSIEFFDCTHGIIAGFTTSSSVGGAYVSTHNYCVPFLANTTFSNGEILSAYPNPTKNTFKLESKDISSIAVFDVLGKQIINKDYNAISAVSLDLSSYNNGIYLVKVFNAEGASSLIKVVKE